MMYNNKLVCCLKANGKILREFNDEVKIPFGSEYSILIKNLHNRRAQVRISIDGVDALGGRALIVNSNSEHELSRFVNDLNSGNSFKFIERTSGIEQHRGIKMDDGIIRITFQYERIQPKFRNIQSYEDNIIFCADPLRSVYSKGLNGSIQCSTAGMAWSGNDQTRGVAASNVINDVGITVPGSISNQKFNEVSGFDVEVEEHIMVLRLSGFVEGKEVIQPITVKTKPKCTICGKQNKATAKFCIECGTALQII